MDLAGGIAVLLSTTTKIASFTGMTARVSEVTRVHQTVASDLARSIAWRNDRSSVRIVASLPSVCIPIPIHCCGKLRLDQGSRC